MICDTIGYCIYWDDAAGEKGRLTPRVKANTSDKLACALHPVASLPFLLVMS